MTTTTATGQITCDHRWHTNFTGTWRECVTCGRHERL